MKHDKTDLTQAPATTMLSGLNFEMPEPLRLDNGIELYVIGGGEDEICRVSVLINGGSFAEQTPLQSTMVALTLGEGNRTMDAATVAETMDYYGALQNTVPYDYHTVTSVSMLCKNMENVLPVVLEGIDGATFNEKDIEPVRRRLIAQCEYLRQQVKYLASLELKRLYYGDKHPLANPCLPESASLLTGELLRQYHNIHFNVENCKIIAAGHITEREIAVINNTFGQWKKHGETAVAPAWWRSPSSDNEAFVEVPDTVQSAISMALPGVPRKHPDYIKLRILATVLGGYFGSRLMSNIREDKGYTYGIGAYLLGRKEDSMIAISSECDTRFVEPVIQEIHNEIDRLRQEPVSESELLTVRQYMLGDLAKTFDTPYSKAATVANQWLYGTYPSYFNEQVRTITEITPDDLIDVAKRYFLTEKMITVVSGNRLHNNK